MAKHMSRRHANLPRANWELADLAVAARKAGTSYGRYVARHDPSATSHKSRKRKEQP